MLRGHKENEENSRSLTAIRRRRDWVRDDSKSVDSEVRGDYRSKLGRQRRRRVKATFGKPRRLRRGMNEGAGVGERWARTCVGVEAEAERAGGKDLVRARE